MSANNLTTAKAPRIVTTLFAAALTVAAFAQPSSAPRATDLTAQFKSAGLAIKGLEAFEVGGIVVIRGRAADCATAEDAGRFALSLGYTRVANLVQITTPPNDAAIGRLAERELSLHRSLDGCTFHVDSVQGVLYVEGTVQRDVQKDMAVEFLRNVDGVKEVRAELTRR